MLVQSGPSIRIRFQWLSLMMKVPYKAYLSNGRHGIVAHTVYNHHLSLD